MLRPRPTPTLFPYTTLFRSDLDHARQRLAAFEQDGAEDGAFGVQVVWRDPRRDRKSTRLNSSHMSISYAVFCLKKKKLKTLTKSTDYPCGLSVADAWLIVPR